MKVRIKFTKEGSMKFVGHLDTMRYFQKALRRAGLPVAFSGGYSPHMIMSFAAPLGVGTTSLGEYFDMELNELVPTDEIEERLNSVMVEGIRVLSARQVEDGKASKAMSLVAAADYLIEFREGKEPAVPWKERMSEFYSQNSISVTKKTKRSEKEINIRPYIYRMELQKDKIFLMLASASANYTKPELVMDTFLSWLGADPQPFCYTVERLEVYADVGTEDAHSFVTLESLGRKVPASGEQQETAGDQYLE
ncbi:MAG: TIGR03936 family radical SAM-associated protein [Eubacteriales bacterium]|nr:TIGR03936 family radical SAM-associated protein [Eubacteriales bacterium]